MSETALVVLQLIGGLVALGTLGRTYAWPWVRLHAPAWQARLYLLGQRVAALAPVLPEPTRILGSALVAGDKLTARVWTAFLNSQPDRYPHVLIIGPTGAGKTTFTRALLALRPGQVTILTPKPDPDDWPDAPIVTIGDDGGFDELTAAFEALGREVRRRLVARKHGQALGGQLTIVCDDWPVLAAECGRPASDVFKLVGRLGRSLRVRLIVLSQSDRVKSLGLEGEGDAVTNFARVELQRGHRATLVAEGHTLPLDTRQVPQLASQPSDPARWWVLPKLEALPGASGRSEALEALPGSGESGPTALPGKRGSAEAIEVSPAERAQIIAAAQLEPSRSKVCQRVFGTRGGRAWEKVKQVCDQEGLLLAEPAGATVVSA
jgi:energy-coupling factor transporter ATP-binding protein EcfA2